MPTPRLTSPLQHFAKRLPERLKTQDDERIAKTGTCKIDLAFMIAVATGTGQLLPMAAPF